MKVNSAPPLHTAFYRATLSFIKLHDASGKKGVPSYHCSNYCFSLLRSLSCCTEHGFSFSHCLEASLKL